MHVPSVPHHVSVHTYRSSRFYIHSTTQVVRSTKYAAFPCVILSVSKFVPLHARKTYGGVEIELQVGVSRQLHAPAILHSENRGWMGARTGLDALERTQISFTRRESNMIPRPSRVHRLRSPGSSVFSMKMRNASATRAYSFRES
jgi:hypothetical protein